MTTYSDNSYMNVIAIFFQNFFYLKINQNNNLISLYSF